jgi:hypothetical protein
MEISTLSTTVSPATARVTNSPFQPPTPSTASISDALGKPKPEIKFIEKSQKWRDYVSIGRRPNNLWKPFEYSKNSTPTFIKLQAQMAKNHYQSIADAERLDAEKCQAALKRKRADDAARKRVFRKLLKERQDNEKRLREEEESKRLLLEAPVAAEGLAFCAVDDSDTEEQIISNEDSNSPQAEAEEAEEEDAYIEEAEEEEEEESPQRRRRRLASPARDPHRAAEHFGSTSDDVDALADSIREANIAEQVAINEGLSEI